MKRELLSVVIPVRNEHENIGRCLDGIGNALRDVEHEILVVYDRDDDTTLPAIDRMPDKPKTVRLVKNQLGPSPSFAIRAGLAASQGDVTVVTMADLSDPPEAILRVAKKVRAGADVVSGSRYMRGGRQIGGPPVKTLLSRAAGLSLAWVAGVTTHDATTSFRGFSRRFLGEVSLESHTGFTFGIEGTVKAHLAGLIVDEVPVTWTDRTAGQSNFRVAKWLGAYLRFYFLAMGAPLLVWSIWLCLALSATLAALGSGSLPAWAPAVALVTIIAMRRLRGRTTVVDGVAPAIWFVVGGQSMNDGFTTRVLLAFAVSVACLVYARSGRRAARR